MYQYKKYEDFERKLFLNALRFARFASEITSAHAPAAIHRHHEAPLVRRSRVTNDETRKERAERVRNKVLSVAPVNYLALLEKANKRLAAMAPKLSIDEQLKAAFAAQI